MLGLFRNEVDWPQDVRLLSEAARIASAVVRIPRQFYELQTVSVYTLLKKTGYFNSPAVLTEAVIAEALNDHPEFIEDWQGYSEDKRCGGWFWGEHPRGGFFIGYLSEKTGWETRKLKRYPDARSACAAFIRREVEGMKGMGGRS